MASEAPEDQAEKEKNAFLTRKMVGAEGV